MNNYSISSINSNQKINFKAFHAPNNLRHGAERLQKLVGEIRTTDQMDINELIRDDFEQGRLLKDEIDILKMTLKKKGAKALYLNYADKDEHESVGYFGKNLFEFYKRTIEDSKPITKEELSLWEKVKAFYPKSLYKMFISLDWAKKIMNAEINR